MTLSPDTHLQKLTLHSPHAGRDTLHSQKQLQYFTFVRKLIATVNLVSGCLPQVYCNDDLNPHCVQTLLISVRLRVWAFPNTMADFQLFSRAFLEQFERFPTDFQNTLNCFLEQYVI